jgi:hypothetical protein
MGIRTAKFTLAAAAELANPDKEGRAAAFSALLAEVQRAGEGAGWKVLPFGHRRLHQIAIVLPPSIQQLTIKLGERSEPRWDTGPTPQDEGTLDCLIYDHQAKSFDGIWDGTEIDAVDALAKFVLTKLRVPAH